MEILKSLAGGFVTGVTLKQRERPRPPVLAMFAKNDEAEKLIIVGLEDGRLNTIYRTRAVLAMITATRAPRRSFGTITSRKFSLSWIYARCWGSVR